MGTKQQNAILELITEYSNDLKAEVASLNTDLDVENMCITELTMRRDFRFTVESFGGAMRVTPRNGVKLPKEQGYRVPFD